jgi:hypothetical protein
VLQPGFHNQLLRLEAEVRAAGAAAAVIHWRDLPSMWGDVKWGLEGKREVWPQTSTEDDFEVVGAGEGGERVERVVMEEGCAELIAM